MNNHKCTDLTIVARSECDNQFVHGWWLPKRKLEVFMEYLPCAHGFAEYEHILSIGICGPAQNTYAQ